jgi:hypothetical protein
MTPDEERPDPIRPSERRGGSLPGEEEAREKGPWAAQARQGVVPADLGGSDAPEEMLPDDPQLGSEATGRTAQSEEPATEGGIDLAAGDHSDAIEQGGSDAPAGAEPDLKDAAAGPRQTDIESAG